MYLVVVVTGNKVIHTKAFDDTVWSKADTAWGMAVDHANYLVSELGCEAPTDHWQKDCHDNSFVWCDVCVTIEKGYTPIKNRGATSIAKAYADAKRLMA